jgi:ferredoxin
MKAKVDETVCVGCELCAQICPGVFSMGVDGYAKVTVDVVPAEHEESCRDAAGSCPVDAIAVIA